MRHGPAILASALPYETKMNSNYLSILRRLTDEFATLVMRVKTVPLTVSVFLSLVVELVFLRNRDDNERSTFPWSAYHGACDTYFGIYAFCPPFALRVAFDESLRTT